MYLGIVPNSSCGTFATHQLHNLTFGKCIHLQLMFWYEAQNENGDTGIVPSNFLKPFDIGTFRGKKMNIPNFVYFMWLLLFFSDLIMLLYTTKCVRRFFLSQLASVCDHILMLSRHLRWDTYITAHRVWSRSLVLQLFLLFQCPNWSLILRI